MPGHPRVEKTPSGVSVWINPSRVTVCGLLRSQLKLRVTKNGGDLFFWNAWLATHNDVGKELGLVTSNSRYYCVDANDDLNTFYRILSFEVITTL